ncbi:MAG TPA: hypothetical protein DEA46_02280 [Candidatus Moranbacteria bacterium]|nr:hypothetical protein [Candidatus Moranbacteria bacterium]
MKQGLLAEKSRTNIFASWAIKMRLPAVFLMCLFSLIIGSYVQAATESIAIVRPDCANKSIAEANCYTSLVAWETAEQKDLVASDQIAVAQIEGSWTSADTGAVFVSGWTTDATRYIKIHTVGEARHSGVWSNSKYRLETSSTVFYVNEENVRIDGLQIHQTDATNNSRYGIRLAPASQSNYYLSNNIIRGNSATNGFFSHAIVTTSGYAGSSIYLWNNIIYNFTSNGTGSGINLGSNHTAYIYNNTINNCFQGIYHISSAYAKNNIVQNTTGEAYSGLIDFETSSNYNVSDDATSTSGANDKINQTVSFSSTVSGSENLHLQASDVSARGAGTNLGSDANLSFSTDIDGETRSGAWDIGADESNTSSLRSDVDGNLASNTTDALLTLRNSIGLNMSATAWQASATTGDVNCNGSSNSTDALLILRYSIGLSMSGTSWCES